MASQTVSGPVVSPACGTLCSPAARAASKCGLNCGRGTPISGPPSPNPTRLDGPWSSATASVPSAPSSPSSPGMSKIQRSTMPRSRSAATRASSMASTNASAGMPRTIEVYGVTVSSAYRMFCAAISAATSYVSSCTSSAVLIRSTTDR